MDEELWIPLAVVVGILGLGFVLVVASALCETRPVQPYAGRLRMKRSGRYTAAFPSGGNQYAIITTDFIRVIRPSHEPL